MWDGGSQEGCSALLWACMKKHLSMCQELLAAGADPSDTDKVDIDNTLINICV